jgi:hypothetical protein
MIRTVSQLSPVDTCTVGVVRTCNLVGFGRTCHRHLQGSGSENSNLRDEKIQEDLEKYAVKSFIKCTLR